MRILKFGGSSVKTAERILCSVDIIQEGLNSEPHTITVVSALGGVTDALISAANLARENEDFRPALEKIKGQHSEVAAKVAPKDSKIQEIITKAFSQIEEKLNGIRLLKELSPKTLDGIIANGEILSAQIMQSVFEAKGISADYVNASQFIFADDNFGNGRVNFQKSNTAIQAFFAKHKGLSIVTGFIAASSSGDLITLGRGGSDYTAAIIGSALDAEEIEIWTDVSGMYTADPSKVSKAFPQPFVSFAEAMELSHFGAKVIYPPTIQPAMAKSIPIVIKNSFEPSAPGTVISKDLPQRNDTICGISSIDEIAFLRLEGGGMVGVAGVARRFFSSLAAKNISVILITQASSEHTICCAIKPNEAKAAKLAVDSEFELEIKAALVEPLIVEKELSIISVVGENMRNTPGVAGKTFSALGKNGVNIIAIAQGSSELNISAVIRKEDVTRALRSLHEEFFFANTKAINVFVIGTGLIGSALVRQIQVHSPKLEKKNNRVRVIGLSNSRVMKINPEGLDTTNLSNELEHETEPANLGNMINIINSFNLPNVAMVDCTASNDVISHYLPALKSNISVVTPNKKAQTSPYKTYVELKQAASRRGVSFLYETSVGAGLPVISTLNDLLRSGDEVIKIEAVLSGTLSFIFNNYRAGKSFADIVLEARDKGYTEPDPRDDLNGLDVARKILILSRECGAKLELENVDVENLVPESCRSTKDIAEFFRLLKASDSHFEEMAKAAESENGKLCYMAVYENGKASVKLNKISSTHPFYNLSGSDNIISFTTKRYNERPLVVKGPGAGAEVTAAGVFADIVRLAN